MQTYNNYTKKRNFADNIFHSNEKQKLHRSYCRCCSHDILGHLVRLVNASLPEPEPHNDHFPATGSGHYFLDLDTIRVSTQRKGETRTLEAICHSGVF